MGDTTQTTVQTLSDAVLDTPDDDGRWMIHPSAEQAAAHATPFPDFTPDCEIGMAVYDLNVAHMVRVAEREASQ